MTLRVYTAPLPHHGRPGYRGPGALDVTRGSGGWGAAFAPSRELLNEANRRKRQAGSDPLAQDAVFAWYEPRYLDEMRASYRRSPRLWKLLLGMGEVTLCCYCLGTKRRCHRFLLADILTKLGARYCGERDLAPPGGPHVRV